MTKQKNKQLPAWDLSDMYKGINDPKIAKDLEKIRKGKQAFAKKYKGKIASLSADDFAAMLKEEEKLSDIGAVLGEFAYLNMVTQMQNKEATGFYQDISEKLTEYSKPMVFWGLELNKLPEAHIKELYKNEKVAFYKPFLTRVRRFKNYELSEEVEEILMEKSITSSDAWVRLYEETCSRLKFYIDGKEYNDAEITKLLLDKDPLIREKAGKEIGRVSKENTPLLTLIYNMIIKDKAIEDVKRGFKTPVSAPNLGENVSDKVVATLAETVRQNYANISHRFYKLKAKWLGVKKIQYWDRNAPLPFAKDTHYSWEESVNIVLKAYKEFSPKLYNIAKNFFENNWIDVPPRQGKRSGAFAAAAGTATHPYLLLNFVGKQNDVLTLAHELGHGCHMMSRRKNGQLNETSRMTTEEVASVFGEMMTFQSMVKSMPDSPEKLALIAGKVSDMINTAIRQIAFHFFETRAHDERRNGELSEDRLSQIWLEEMRASLGKYVEVDENSAHIWNQIGHFFFRPFYVYAYSFADCLVNSLYQVSQEGKVKDFPDKYLDMLTKTAITDYDKLFKPFGLNPNDADFWNKGLSLISSYIDELERLDKKLGKQLKA